MLSPHVIKIHWDNFSPLIFQKLFFQLNFLNDVDVAFGVFFKLRLVINDENEKKNMIVNILFKNNLILKIWFCDQNQEIQVYLEDVMPFKICLRWLYQFANVARYPLNDTCKQYNQETLHIVTATCIPMHIILFKRIVHTPPQFCSLNITVTCFYLFKFISVYHWNIQNIIMPFTFCLFLFISFHFITKNTHVRNVSFLLYVTSYIRYLNNAWSSFAKWKRNLKKKKIMKPLHNY